MAFIMGASLLGGCVAPASPPPVLVVEDFRAWFEDDLVVVNVTLRNVSNLTLGPSPSTAPDVVVRMTRWRERPPGDWAPGEGLEWIGTDMTMLSFWGLEYPRYPRYYDLAAQKSPNGSVIQERRTPSNVGPVVLGPGDAFATEFAFLHRIAAGEEDIHYHAARVDVHLIPIPREGDRGDEYHSGCFNPRTPPFYGWRSDGPSCPHYDREGRETRSEIAKECFLNDSRTEGVPPC